jgi:predicted Zn-dependent peptidase
MNLLLAMTMAASLMAPEGQLRLPPYKKVKLKNGITLLLMEQHEVPIVSFSFIIKAGSAADPAGKEGLASITAELLGSGTRTRSAEKFSEELDSIGGQFSASASADYSGGSAEFLKKDLNKGLELLADALLNPTFPQDEVTKLIKRRTDQIRSAKDRALGIIRTYFNAYLYGDHPYGKPPIGTETSLAAITREDVVNFYQTNYAPQNTILVAVGDFNADQMEKMLAEKFETWEPKSPREIKIPEPKQLRGRKLLLIDKPDSTQTFYMIGNLGISRTNPDRVYIEVVNTLFGGRFTSMLNTELRVNSGLTYGASSFFDQRKERGPFAIITYTQNANTEKAIDMTLDILKRLHEKGFTEEELRSAKNYIKGRFPTNIETSNQLASLLAELEFYGLDQSEINEYFAKIDAMTPEDARRIIRQYFPLEDLVFVLIGKASQIESVAKKYVPQPDKKSITQPGF